jgi:deoxyribodipyrimidine photo-lyase
MTAGATSRQVRGGFPPSRHEAEKRLAEAVRIMTDKQLAALRTVAPAAGSHTGTSMLSPYIRHRVITEQEVLAAIVRGSGRRDSALLIEGLFWRAYWKGWLELRPHVWDVFDKSVASLIASSASDSSNVLLSRAVLGGTGIDCFDAWAQELADTGYLHHQARRAYASIWVHTLRLPWELGAEHMQRHLLDGDPAINLLSWRWVAGIQDTRKPQVVTQDELGYIFKGRFKSSGLADVPAEPAASGLPGAGAMPPAHSLRAQYRAPGLLVTLEDLRPEDLVRPDLGIRAVAVVPDVMTRLERRPSLAVRRFRADLLEDAGKRFADVYGAPVEILGEFTPDAVVQWARSAGLTDVLVPYSPVGAVRRQMKAVRAALGAVRIRMTVLRRGWDSVLWVHSAANYSRLRMKIPQLVGLLGRSGRPEQADRRSEQRNLPDGSKSKSASVTKQYWSGPAAKKPPPVFIEAGQAPRSEPKSLSQRTRGSVPMKQTEVRTKDRD